MVDAPLLVDTGPTDLADRVILVTAPASTRKERIILRGLTGDEAEARIAAQEPDAKQARWADFILENDGTRDELIDKAEALWKRLVS